MKWRLVRALLLLPGMGLLVIPGILLWLTSGTAWAWAWAAPDHAQFWAALLVGGLGLFFFVWTIGLFAREGHGTPAPWDPPAKLVLRGPYRHVRNPMIASVLLLLLAETLALQSWALASWLVFFFTVNAIYFPLVEEPELERRFGEDYRIYKVHVPRWIPRPRPWSGL